LTAAVTAALFLSFICHHDSSLVAFAFTETFQAHFKPNLMPNATIRPSGALSMAMGGIHGKKTRMLQAAKKKKTKDPNKVGKHRKTSNKERNNNTSAEEKRKSSKSPSSTIPQSTSTRPKLSILGETKRGGPPWQVMGERDMKKNVAAEKVRRARIHMGLDSPSLGSGSNAKRRLKADVTGSNRLLSPADRSMLSWKRFNPAIVGFSDLTLVGAYLDKRLPPSLGVPEVAFLGRSNVGKSSLLNKLVSRAAGDTARVGKMPGATAAVNLYALLEQSKKRPGGSDGEAANPIIGFADLPGFGYAKLSKDTKESVEEAAERYLGKRRELALGVLLVDSRRIPNADDRAVLAALFDMGVPLIVVATKSDKLKASEIESAMGAIREGLGLPDGQPLRVSGVTGEGVRDLWRIILDACETRVNELKVAIEEGRDDGGSMRVITDEEGETDDFYDDFEGEEDDSEEEFEDDDDIFYDQGYDWVQGESFGAQTRRSSDEFYDDFYDGDDDFEGSVAANNWDKGNQMMSEKEAFKLKNLKKRVNEMERRGEL
jgi:GTP-binding protein